MSHFNKLTEPKEGVVGTCGLYPAGQSTGDNLGLGWSLKLGYGVVLWDRALNPAR